MEVRRNIGIAYFLSFAFHSWFWLGSWIFYYLRFGDYASVALLDSGAVAMTLVMEIPTGAFADLMGKKKTLFLAFLLQGLGNILMGISGNFWMLAISLWLFTCVGGAFFSGSLEALVYDSLKSLKEENVFDKVMGGLGAARLWAISICGIIGGFSYYLYPGLPFILNGVVCLVGMIACAWLVEPVIDTNMMYSAKGFIRQNVMGFKTLFGNSYMRRLTTFLVVTGAFGVLVFQLLDDLLAVEYGYSPIGVSVLFSVSCLIAGFGSFYLPRMKVKFDQQKLLIVSMVVVSMTLVISPWIGMFVFGGFTLLRIVFEVLYENASSVVINSNTESESRTTTLSSLSLLRNVPYALGGAFIGALIQFSGGAMSFALWFGVAMLTLTLFLGRGIGSNKHSGNA